jgi:fatty acid desaturase
MEQPLSNEQKYKAAKAHVLALQGFYIHLLVFSGVMSGLAVLDYSKGDTWWVQWPLLGWGLAVLAHAFFVFSAGFTAVSNWQERKIRETMSKM